MPKRPRSNMRMGSSMNTLNPESGEKIRITKGLVRPKTREHASGKSI
jgi:hypothetical protein